MTARETFDVFISAAREDEALARELREALVARGLSVWSEGGLKPGDRWDDALENGLRDSRVIVLLVSRRWQHSAWTAFELGAALSISQATPGRRLIPILAEGVEHDDLPKSLGHIRSLSLDAGLETVASGIAEVIATDVADAGAMARPG